MTIIDSNIADDPTAADQRFAASDVRGFLAWALGRFGDHLAVSLSLGVEDSIVYHLLDELSGGRGPRVFTLDTGRLPNESYELLDRLRARYRLPIETYFPRTEVVQELYAKKGPTSFYNSVDDRKECCAIRKVEPLERALVGVDAWIVGLRRAQGPTRAALGRVERDEEARWKLSPLAHFSTEATFALARELDVPLHALHAQGYPSIGCAPCTRAVAPGEPERAGRWWWEDPSQKECGIHTRRGR